MNVQLSNRLHICGVTKLRFKIRPDLLVLTQTIGHCGIRSKYYGIYPCTLQLFESYADPPLEFAKLNIADITGNGKNSYFSYLCTSTVIRQTESIHKIIIK